MFHTQAHKQHGCARSIDGSWFGLSILNSRVPAAFLSNKHSWERHEPVSFSPTGYGLRTITIDSLILFVHWFRKGHKVLTLIGIGVPKL